MKGDFFYGVGDIPHIKKIDATQPVHVGYYPPITGLNSNFNQIFFECWNKNTVRNLPLYARGKILRTQACGIKISSIDRDFPVFEYVQKGTAELWTVADNALAKDGGKWLPVRKPKAHTAETLASLLKSRGIKIGNPKPIKNIPLVREIRRHQSQPLSDILKHMLKYSINLTAEAVGLAATQSRAGIVPRL